MAPISAPIKNEKPNELCEEVFKEKDILESTSQTKLLVMAPIYAPIKNEKPNELREEVFKEKDILESMSQTKPSIDTFCTGHNIKLVGNTRKLEKNGHFIAHFCH